MLRNRILAAAAITALALTAACASAKNGSGGLSAASSTTPSAAHVTATPTQTATAKATKTASSGGGGGGTSSGSDWPSHPDCISYHPGNLTVDGPSSDGIVLVEDGSTIVIRAYADSDQTAAQALALAQRYSEHCYIGRNNSMDPKGDYVFDYWRDPSGQTPDIPDPDDNLCSSYNNKNLTVDDMGDGDGWRVKDHDHVLQEFQDQSQANDGDLVLRKYSQMCEIGGTQDDNDDLGQVDFQR